MHCSTSGTGLVLLPSNGTSCDRYDHGSFRLSINRRWERRILQHIFGSLPSTRTLKIVGTEYAFSVKFSK